MDLYDRYQLVSFYAGDDAREAVASRLVQDRFWFVRCALRAQISRKVNAVDDATSAAVLGTLQFALLAPSANSVGAHSQNLCDLAGLIGGHSDNGNRLVASAPETGDIYRFNPLTLLIQTYLQISWV